MQTNERTKLYHPLGNSYEAHPDSTVNDIAQVEDGLIALVPCFPDGVVKPGAQRLTVAEHGSTKLGVENYRVVLSLSALHSSQQGRGVHEQPPKSQKNGGPGVTERATNFVKETANQVHGGYLGAKENAQSVAQLLGVKAEEYRSFAANKAVEWKDFFNDKYHDATEGVGAAHIAVVNSIQKALSDITRRLHDWRTRGSQPSTTEAPRDVGAEQKELKDGIWKRVEQALQEMRESVTEIKNRTFSVAETRGETTLETLKVQWRTIDEKLHEAERTLRERTSSLLHTYFGSSASSTAPATATTAASTAPAPTAASTAPAPTAASTTPSSS